MKLLLLALIFSSTDTWAQTPYEVDGRCDDYKNVKYDNEEMLRLKAECQCKPPAEDYILEKLKTIFEVAEAEQLMREVVTDEKNYELREQVKAGYRRLRFARVLQKKTILRSIASDFDQMIDGAGLRSGVRDYPTKGADSSFSADEGTLVLTMKGLKKVDKDFLSEDIARNLEPVVSIRYFYPIDRFEYVLTYKGRRLPANEAANVLQDDFYTACYNGFWDNVRIRKANARDRKEIEDSKVQGQ